MLYMGAGIDLQARMQGGLMKGLMRKFLAGESLFMSVFRCTTASAHLALANPIAGKIIPIQLNGNTILAERNAYLCAIGNVDLTLPFSRLANRLMAAAGGHRDESKGFGGIAGDVLGNLISGD